MGDAARPLATNNRAHRRASRPKARRTAAVDWRFAIHSVDKPPEPKMTRALSPPDAYEADKIASALWRQRCRARAWRVARASRLADHERRAAFLTDRLACFGVLRRNGPLGLEKSVDPADCFSSRARSPRASCPGPCDAAAVVANRFPGQAAAPVSKLRIRHILN